MASCSHSVFRVPLHPHLRPDFALNRSQTSWSSSTLAAVAPSHSFFLHRDFMIYSEWRIWPKSTSRRWKWASRQLGKSRPHRRRSRVFAWTISRWSFWTNLNLRLISTISVLEWFPFHSHPRRLALLSCATEISFCQNVHYCTKTRHLQPYC